MVKVAVIMVTGGKGSILGMGGGGAPVAESVPVVIVTGENGVISGIGGGGIPVAVNFAVVTTREKVSCPGSAFTSFNKA